MAGVRILYDVEGWAYHHRALALQRYAPPDLEVSTWLASNDQQDARIGPDPVDLLFVLPERRIRDVQQTVRRRHWDCRVVRSWNSGWPYRITAFHECFRDSDRLIINNRDYWDRVGRLSGTTVIPNGVDLRIFNISVPLRSRKPKVLWTGSTTARHRKGYEEFILPLQRELAAAGIDFDYLLVDSYGHDKRTLQQMAAWYNTGTILLCASSAEGTPNPALEAAACGCTVVSTAVGNMPELIRHGINGYLVSRDLEAMLDAIQAARENYLQLAEQMQHDIQAWDWPQRSREFFQVFREVMDTRSSSGAAGPSESKPDYSDQVTVFVNSPGAPSREACLCHLAQQDCTFRLEVGVEAAPPAVRLQRLRQQCLTPYFVAVDEDMLLFPHAVRTLVDRIRNSSPAAASLVAKLYHVHRERCLPGVTILRRDIAGDEPCAEPEATSGHPTCPAHNGDAPEELPSANGAGTANDALGLTGAFWTARSIYEHCARLQRDRRKHKQASTWCDDYPALFLKRFLSEPSELNFFALMGVAAGTLAAVDPEDPQRYLRAEESPAGFEALRRFFDELGQDLPHPTSNMFFDPCQWST